MHRFFLFGFLAIAMLSGCLSDDAPIDDAEGVATDSEAESWNDAPSLVRYESCHELLALVPVPMDAVAGFAPEGFTVVPFDPAGTHATVAGISLDCEQNGSEVNELLGLLAVEPPAELAAANATMHVVMIGGFGDNEEAHAAYVAWGFGDVFAMTTDIRQDTVVSAALGGVGGTSGGMATATDGDFGATLVTRVAGPQMAQDAGSVRVFPANDATHAMDVSWTGSAAMQGGAEMHLSMGGVPISASGGIGVHNWGDDYIIEYRQADLSVVATSEADEPDA